MGARRRRSITDPQGSKPSDEDLTIGPIPVTDEVTGRLFRATGFRDLVRDPFCGRMSCDANSSRYFNSASISANNGLNLSGGPSWPHLPSSVSSVPRSVSVCAFLTVTRGIGASCLWLHAIDGLIQR